MAAFKQQISKRNHSWRIFSIDFKAFFKELGGLLELLLFKVNDADLA